MNNKIIAGIVVVIVIIAGVFLVTRNKGGNSEVASNTESASEATGTSAENGSIKSLIMAGSTRKCTFKTSENGTESSGTIYTASGKMRGDFTSKVNGVESGTHMIYDGTTSHVWVDGQGTGFKMTLDVNKADDKSSSGSVDTNKNFEFDCSSWSADNSKFDLPSGIEFTEMPTLPTGSMNGDAQTSGAMSSDELRKQVCNSLSGTAKEQCLASIK